MKNIALFVTLLIAFVKVNGQELNCQVVVDAARIEGTNKQRFETLQNSISEFLNSTAWTDQNYQLEERIDVNISFVIMQEVASNQFSATLQIQSRRPVYGTSYYSPMFNYKDNRIQFKYNEFEPLLYNEQIFQSNLVSILSYYAYLIIGIDRDSFESMGGEPYFQKARKILELAQNQGYLGWEVSSNRTNRYWIIENILSQTYRGAREASYTYHIDGLDRMESNIAKAKENIFIALKKLSNSGVRNPNQNIIQNFMDAKTDEIFDIFSFGDGVNKEELKAILNTLSPTLINKWESL